MSPSTALKAMLPGGVVRMAGHVRRAPKRAFIAALRAPATRRGLRLLVDMTFDPFDPAFRADPYPFYHRLRAQDPVHRSPFGIWLITRYADAAAMLTDSRFAHPDYRIEARRANHLNPFRTLRSNSLLTLNPPDHTRLRRIVGEVFTPAVVADVRPRIQKSVDRLLDCAAPTGQMDAVTDFGLPLAVEIVAHIFGISVADGLHCHQFVRRIAAANDLFPSAADVARAGTAASQLMEYFGGLIRECRSEPRPGLVSALVQAHARTGDLSDGELLSITVLLFMAGHETVMAFLGLAVRSLLSDPTIREGLLQGPAMAARVVDELLRCEPPVQLIGRQAQEDVSLGGRRIRGGETVFVAFGAVNRDPARFSDPDRLDFGRQENHHFAFGHGIHACIGQSLARMEAQIALDGLVRRFPDLRPGPGLPEWRDSIVLRALDRLPVSW